MYFKILLIFDSKCLTKSSKITSANNSIEVTTSTKMTVEVVTSAKRVISARHIHIYICRCMSSFAVLWIETENFHRKVNI